MKSCSTSLAIKEMKSNYILITISENIDSLHDSMFPVGLPKSNLAIIKHMTHFLPLLFLLFKEKLQ
jgi:hypothetical protein